MNRSLQTEAEICAIQLLNKGTMPAELDSWLKKFDPSASAEDIARAVADVAVKSALTGLKPSGPEDSPSFETRALGAASRPILSAWEKIRGFIQGESRPSKTGAPSSSDRGMRWNTHQDVALAASVLCESLRRTRQSRRGLVMRLKTEFPRISEEALQCLDPAHPATGAPGYGLSISPISLAAFDSTAQRNDALKRAGEPGAALDVMRRISRSEPELMQALHDEACVRMSIARMHALAVGSVPRLVLDGMGLLDVPIVQRTIESVRAEADAAQRGSQRRFNHSDRARRLRSVFPLAAILPDAVNALIDERGNISGRDRAIEAAILAGSPMARKLSGVHFRCRLDAMWSAWCHFAALACFSEPSVTNEPTSAFAIKAGSIAGYAAAISHFSSPEDSGFASRAEFIASWCRSWDAIQFTTTAHAVRLTSMSECGFAGAAS